MIKVLWCACVALALFHLPAQAQDSLLRKEIEQEATTLRIVYHVPGISVAVVKDDRVILCEGFGVANVERKIPFDTNTVGRLASATKFFTSLGMLTAAQKGIIDLDAPLKTYLENLPATWEDIPLWRLLNLTSGIPGTEKTPFDNMPDAEQRKVSEHALFDLLTPLALDSGWHYRQTGYMTAAMIIGDKTGTSWPQFLQDQVLTPAGMINTAHNDVAVYPPDLVPKNYVYGDDGKFVNAPFFFPLVLATGAGYNTTAADMARLFLAINHGKVLSPPLIEQQEFDRGRMYLLGDSNFYSIASEIKKFGPYLTIGHSGGPDIANIRYVPGRKIGVAVLANRNTTGICEMLTNRILKRMLLDSAFGEQPKPIGFVVRMYAPRQSDDQLLDTYQRFKTKGLCTFDNEEDDLNGAGYEFLNQHDYTTALRIFRLIVHEHPSSANAYDSLGEACLKGGDKKGALENYKKSLALNPGNDTAKKVIAQLTSHP
jgi:CubicO group peptidase (beta-lactamase class C family)